MIDENDLALDLVKAKVEASPFWRELIYVEQTGSTNDVAKRLALEGAPEGTVVIADEQMTGRGRLDRRWLAPSRTSLLCSLLFRPLLEVAQAHRLTMVCSMAAADAIAQVADLRVALKWPNDLIVRSSIEGDTLDRGTWRKLAGVLTESTISDGALDFIVVGIGINVNIRRGDLAALDPRATSIMAEVGRRVRRAALLVALLNGVDNRYQRLRHGESPHQEWSARLATVGRLVRATTSDGIVKGIAEGVGEDGALLVRTEDGERRRLLTADVALSGE